MAARLPAALGIMVSSGLCAQEGVAGSPGGSIVGFL